MDDDFEKKVLLTLLGMLLLSITSLILYGIYAMFNYEYWYYVLLSIVGIVVLVYVSYRTGNWFINQVEKAESTENSQ